MASGISDRIPGETLFTRFHEPFGPGIKDVRFDPLPPTEVTNRGLPSETLQKMRIWSSGAYFRQALIRTCRMKVSVSWVEISATWA
jgi:hypothetical protein